MSGSQHGLIDRWLRPIRDLGGTGKGPKGVSRFFLDCLLVRLGSGASKGSRQCCQAQPSWNRGAIGVRNTPTL